jgi:hypothetical protein
MKVKIALITTCTNRKTRAVPRALTARELPPLPTAGLAKEWVRRLKNAEGRLPASNLYCGRAFREAQAAASENDADLHIISAGYGLLSAQDLVSPYSVTVSAGTADSLRGNRRQVEAIALDQWWLRVNAAFGRRQPLSRLVQRAPNGLYVLAISTPYLNLIRADLDELPDRLLERLRIIGPPVARQEGGDRWLTAAIAYDERLDGPDSHCRGTRSDFPQRAARHFLRTVGRGRLHAPIDEHRRLVEESLAEWRAPRRKDRPRYSDEELRAVIDQMWDQAGGQVGRGLRLLRDKKKIACEQSRFKRLFWEVAAQKE